MLKFVICDDEIYMVNRLSALFEKSFIKNNFNAEIILKTTDYNELISFVSSNSVDVVVLDIEFKSSKLNGLDIANQIRKISKECYLIFITSHFEYVLEAYKYTTFDYLIKGSVNLETITSTLTRLFEDATTNNTKFLQIDTKGTYIDLDTIQFIEKSGMKIIYHSFMRDYEAYSTFNKILDILPENYVRCHKSFIVNVKNIDYVNSVDNTIFFKNGTFCYIGPKYKETFMEVIKYASITE